VEEQVEGYTVYPWEWGIPVPPPKKAAGVKPEDIELLETIRETFRDEFEGRPVPYKFYISTLVPEGKPLNRNSVVAGLHRMQAAGLVDKFAKQLHTNSGRFEYVSWYVWEDKRPYPPRGDPGTPVYIVQEQYHRRDDPGVAAYPSIERAGRARMSRKG